MRIGQSESISQPLDDVVGILKMLQSVGNSGLNMMVHFD